MSQTITALYDSRTDAETAQAKLLAAGIPQSGIRLIAGSQTQQANYDRTRDEGGFWASLKDIFVPDEDRHSYTEGLSRGGTLLTATIDDAHVDTAMDIMEEHGSVDLAERETAWKNEGWSGYSATSQAPASAGAMGTTRELAGSGAAGLAGSAAITDTGTAHAATGETDVIPVVEERLNVGKRVAENGRVRVRSYAVETPVTENVTLHDETVQVERHAVDRPVTAADEALFTDRTIEATERREEAVVSKEARVVEEVGIRKDATERTETVSDTVRKTEVEVEDGRGNVSRTGTTGDGQRNPL
jgi:uncharacterized protein (TIGR02271 family)